MQQTAQQQHNVDIHWFQSSSSPKAGCNWNGIAFIRDPYTFQSSSSPKAGCNRGHHLVDRVVGGVVSILIQPEGRMQPVFARQVDAQRLAVSILIQPEGRMQLGDVVEPEGRHPPVSILIQPEGRMQRARTLRDSRGLGCFNPHPARRPDATGLPYPHHQGEHEVSILIQPEGRMQLLHG